MIREVVGHRPFRPSGFVVRAEDLDGKTLVHNYGHGGGGISLAWGSSALAIRELGSRAPGRVAVIGSGIMGLTSARLLQDAGWQVTIYTRDVTMQIDPGTLLRALNRDFRLAGGSFVIRNFASADEVLALAEPVLFNCTGLGAAALFGDAELIPAKGQLVFLPPDPAVDYMTLGGGRGQLYMFPRTDVLLLGGTFKPGDYSTHPEPEETERIVGEHARLFAEFG